MAKATAFNNKCFRCQHCASTGTVHRCGDAEDPNVKRPPGWRWVLRTDSCANFKSKTKEEMAYKHRSY